MGKPSIFNLDKMGPDKPIETVSDAIGYLKRLSKSMEGKVPYTADRIRQCMMVLKKVQQREQNRKTSKGD